MMVMMQPVLGSSRCCEVHVAVASPFAGGRRKRPFQSMPRRAAAVHASPAVAASAEVAANAAVAAGPAVGAELSGPDRRAMRRAAYSDWNNKEELK